MLYFIRTDCGCELRMEALPEKPRWQALVQLTESPAAGLSQQLCLVDTSPPGTLLFKPGEPPPHSYIYNVHLLKSNLQKCFRRRLYTETMATAKQLLYQDPTEMLRRLPVILLEDSLLYPYLYNQVVWLQFAHSKGYELTVEDAQIILDATCTGLESPARYNLSYQGTTTEARTGSKAFHATSRENRDAFIGPRLRSLAGGMKFDTNFLRVLAFRALMEDLPLETEYSSMELADAEEFAPVKHMIPQSVDFHACPFLLETIPHKDTIWWHWSSLNTRPIKDHQADIAEGADNAHRIQHEQTYKNIERTLHVNARSTIDNMMRDRKKTKKTNTLDGWLAKAKAKAPK
jgi:hypothetical protein